MAGGARLKLGTQSSRPSPSPGCPGQPQGLGATPIMMSQQKQLTGSPSRLKGVTA